MIILFLLLILINPNILAIKSHESKKALITGITGQDGSYLAEFLLEKNYEVHGLCRRSSLCNTARIEHLLTNSKLILHFGDLTDASNLTQLIKKIQPDEIYNLAAQSHVMVSFEVPQYTAHADAVGTLLILEAIKTLNLKNKTKFYQASTSEMFGKVQEIPQTENTPFYPRSPYGCAKLYAHWITVNYREAYQIFAVSGILFNHESPRRGENFVTRKITLGVAKIKNKLQDKLILGNLDAKRDWGYAKDYVEAMWLMLQQPVAKDFVIATGNAYSVREFVELAFNEIGIKIDWIGEGVNEKGIDQKTGSILVEIDKNNFRPTEVDYLLGNPENAKKMLCWKPRTSLKELVKIMVENDLKNLKN